MGQRAREGAGGEGSEAARKGWLAFNRELRWARLKNGLGRGERAGAEEALEERFKEALGKEFERLSADFESIGAVILADTFKRLRYREAEASSQKAIEKALARFGAAGGFDASLRAVEAAMGWESPLRPGTLALAMARLATEPSAAPEEAARRVMALAGAQAIWDPKSPLSQASQTAREPIGWRYEEERRGALTIACAQIIQTAARKPQSSEAAVVVIKGLQEREGQGWGPLGDGVAERLAALDVATIPEALLRGLPGGFWLALKTGVDPKSGLSQSVLSDLLVEAQKDPWLKDQLCLSVWSGLDLFEIGAFEAAFPAESQKAIGRALSDTLAEGAPTKMGSWALWAGLGARVARASKRPGGEWASGLKSVKALSERGPVMAGRDPQAGEGLFMEIRACWEARELSRSLPEAPSAGGLGRL